MRTKKQKQLYNQIKIVNRKRKRHGILVLRAPSSWMSETADPDTIRFITETIKTIRAGHAVVLPNDRDEDGNLIVELVII